MNSRLTNFVAYGALGVSLIVGGELALHNNDRAGSVEARAQALDVLHESPEEAAKLHKKADEYEGKRDIILEINVLGGVLGAILLQGMGKEQE